MSKPAKNFVWEEFVHPDIMNNKRVLPQWFVDPRIPTIAQALKDGLIAKYSGTNIGGEEVKTVVVVVNNWHTGGTRENCGFRMPDSKVGGNLSQHKHGRALDCLVYLIFKDGSRERLSPHKVRRYILDNEVFFMKLGVTTLESGTIATTWTHIDCRETGQSSIWICGGVIK